MGRVNEKRKNQYSEVVMETRNEAEKGIGRQHNGLREKASESWRESAQSKKLAIEPPSAGPVTEGRSHRNPSPVHNSPQELQ